MVSRHLRDSASRGAHAHRDFRAFKRRTGCRRRAEQSLLVPNHDLAIGSKINRPTRSSCSRSFAAKIAGQATGSPQTRPGRQKAYFGVPCKLPPPGRWSGISSILLPPVQKDNARAVRLRSRQKKWCMTSTHHHHVDDFECEPSRQKKQLLKSSAPICRRINFSSWRCPPSNTAKCQPGSLRRLRSAPRRSAPC